MNDNTIYTRGQSKVSVMVLVYNSSQFVERCLRSLLEQTLEDIEYIIINDHTTDNSMEIAERVIEEYPHRKEHFKIVNHSENQGIGYSRQEAIDLATGEYVIYCDSDDWVDHGYLQALYDKANETEADIVSAGFITERGERSFMTHSHWFADPQAFVANRQFMFLSLWSHLIKRSFIVGNGISFYPGLNFSEDLAFLFSCYCLSRCNAAYDGDQLYHYNKLDNPNSATVSTFSPAKLAQRAMCIRLIEDMLRDHKLDGSRNGILLEEKRSTKEAYLQLPEPNFRQWHDNFPEMTAWLVRKPGMSIPCKIAWLMGQHIHPSILKLYTKISKITR